MAIDFQARFTLTDGATAVLELHDVAVRKALDGYVCGKPPPLVPPPVAVDDGAMIVEMPDGELRVWRPPPIEYHPGYVDEFCAAHGFVASDPPDPA